MSRSLTVIALLSAALAVGCVSASAQKVRLTADKAQVKDCKLLGTVGDSWRDAEKKTRANDIATAAGVPSDTIFVLDVEHGEDQVYTCPSAAPK